MLFRSAGLAYLIYRNWDGIAAYVGQLWATVVATFERGRDRVGAIVDHVIEVWSPLVSFYKGLWDEVTSIFDAAWARIQPVVDLVGGAVSRVKGAIGGAVDKVGGWFGGGADTAAAPADSATTGARAGGSLLQSAPSRSELNGEMVVRFENVPPGTRVEPGKTNQSGVEFNPDVGYRSMALGY